MELYCEHHDSVFNDDDTFLLDDENTTSKQLQCLKCSDGSRTEKNENFNSVIKIEGNSWIQNKNGVITGMCCNERLNVNGDNLDSPEDSPLLTSVSNFTIYF